MQKTAHFPLFVSVIATLLVGACSTPAATPSVGSGNGKAISVGFTGLVESIAGNQWVINGQTVTVDPAVVYDGPFNVGDQVKVEGVVGSDGYFFVFVVELPTPAELSTLPQFGNASSSNKDNFADANSNAVNTNDINSHDVNVNDDNSNANINDDHGNPAKPNDDNSNPATSNDGS